MRIAIALVMFLLIASVGVGMLRSIRRAPASVPLPRAEAPPAGTRITYWCETCGTELLLLRKGSEAPPRHCGEGMSKREEVARSPG